LVKNYVFFEVYQAPLLVLTGTTWPIWYKIILL